MGASASIPSHLPARELFRLSEKYQMSIAELEYCYSRYRRMSRLEETPKGPVPALKLAFEQDWLLSEIYGGLFYPNSSGEPPKNVGFNEFLERLTYWKASSAEEKLETFFKILDCDRDGSISKNDLIHFLEKSCGMKLAVGDNVVIKADGRRATLCFLGTTKFSAGTWAGLELVEASGKHDGIVNGVRYFQCKPQQGLFVDPQYLMLESVGTLADSLLQRLQPDRPTTRATPTSSSLGSKGEDVEVVNKTAFFEYFLTERSALQILDRPLLPPALHSVDLAGVLKKSSE